MGIYVWGTGCGVAELLDQGFDLSHIDSFVDSFPCADTFLGKKVIKPESLKAEDCQLIIVTTRFAEEVSQFCRQLGISDEKLLFLKNSGVIYDRNDKSNAKDLLEPELLRNILPRQQLISTPSFLKETGLENNNDFVRIATLQLLCRKIVAVPGATAELGVYKGSFARFINKFLPERKLYLFDSFDGFDRQESQRELDSQHCTEAFLSAHKNTSAQQVYRSMPYPESVIIKEGIFPGSLGDLDERFCLVSLDADFYDTTLEGLRYFWPRLSKGAFLMLHDWNSPKLRGVADALKQYEQEIDTTLPAIPIPDLGGTLVLAKT